MKSYIHFTSKERESIYLLLKQNKKISEIAIELGRNKSSISKEIKRNSSANKEYNPFDAKRFYENRRKNSKRKYKIYKDKELYNYIDEKIKKYWSPEIIAKKWNVEHTSNKISFSTIYSAIYRGEFKRVKAQSHLRRRGKKKYGKRNRFNTIHPDHTIHERPIEVETRERIGDWEGDTIRSSPGKGCFVTYVDRKSRKLLIALSKDMSAKSIYEATLKAFRGIHPKTITLDNGSEFAMFRELEKKLNTTIYFADPHSPWQRGSNENTNGLLRFFFPRGMDFRKVSERKIKKVEKLINDRPRLCLNLYSPNEIFLLHLH